MANPNKFEYRFTRDQSLPLQVSHGVWGGITPQGNIELNFFYESEDIPEKMERLVSEDGTILHEETTGDDSDIRHFTRCVNSRILVSYDTAVSICNWLCEQLDQMDRNQDVDPSGNQSAIIPTSSGCKQ